MKTFKLTLTTLIISICLSFQVNAQGYEYGDAPEGVLAYPSTGVVGLFPTCITVGPNSFVQHNNFGAVLGPTFDFEGDGNAGLCPGFAPYDNDECFLDNDAGLLLPEPFTIVNGVVVTCPNSVGTSLGAPCAIANWGIDIDIDLSNNMPSMTPGVMNVVFDFNQNGVWGDMVTCPSGPVPEHVLQNFTIPWGFAGPLSALAPPPFTIGPNTGYVWARFTISEQAVQPNWDGHAMFEDGESEDYLILIQAVASSDFGDAPEDVLAYPSNGVFGAFPTCINVGVNGFVQHIHFGADLGPGVDYEADGNAGLCPGFAPYDNDECFNDGDAGLLFPDSYTIVAGAVTSCPNAVGATLGYPCDTAVWGSNVDIDVNNFMPTQADGFMNVLVDWNKDGDWGDTVYCDDILVPEHVLQNFVIPTGHTGPLSSLLPPDFIIGPDEGYFWCRFTISDISVNVPWDGNGFFEDGESEDYLLRVDTIEVGNYEYGDAPDGVIAYPANGVNGNFPTCMNVPASGWVSHMNFGAILGPTVDFENEGNASLCPLFTPYDNDECFLDNDAGLIMPDPFTIQGGVVVPCPNSTGTPLGFTCTQAVWGTNVDIDVQNFMPNQTVGYMNVLFDFSRNGAWGDIPNCPTGPAPEHVLVNFPIPNGYTGPLSGLAPPNFLIGPFNGYVWARFTISEMPVATDWDGQGSFEDGESEDYLIRIDQDISDADYGDAPEGAMAYPSLNLNGAFPTCTGVGPPNYYVSHLQGGVMYFGSMVDYEPDGNAGLCSPFNLPYDNDECFQDGDAGLVIPAPYTIQLTGGVHVVVPCTGTGGILDSICNMVQWGPELDIKVVNNGSDYVYMNVLMDWNHGGTWGLDTSIQCNGITVPEHVLVNFIIPAGYNGLVSGLNPPAFMAGPQNGYIWSRFTISYSQVPANWDGAAIFEGGESEDYLLYLDIYDGIGEFNPFDQNLNLQIFPNPTNNSCTITYQLQYESDINIEVYDIRGSLLRKLSSNNQSPGTHQVVWDGTTNRGEDVTSGIYIITVSLDNIPVERAKVLMSR